MKSHTGTLLLALAAAAAPVNAQAPQTASVSAAGAACDSRAAGITLPAGFCATIFADSLAGPRHLTVAPNGDVFVALLGRRGGSGGVVALRDTDHDGRADRRESSGTTGGSEVALFDGYLYTENTTSIQRQKLADGSLVPAGPVQTVVKDLPGRGHSAKTFAISRDGSLYVNFGSETNACQTRDRAPGVAGADPCTELERRAGIWRFDARKLDQTPATGEHFARGIRNAMGIAINPVDNSLYVTQHGRDQLSQNWPAFFNDSVSAETPAEELFHVSSGDDFGWPYCYYDRALGAKVLAPEYGGNGKTVGRCAEKKSNVASFPGHWAPNALMFYTGEKFPARYRNGAFIAFHGSWNRAPRPQAGFNVVFVPFQNGGAAGDYEVFADGFASNLNVGRRGAGNRRPTGLAQGPDGALYVSDDAMGRIWKITYAP